MSQLLVYFVKYLSHKPW